MKKLPYLLLLVAALLLSACGGDDDATSTASPDDPTDSSNADDGDDQPPVNPDEPLGAGPYAVADLTVTYNHPDTGEITYQFACFGDTATLVGEADGVDAVRACTALTEPDAVDRLVNGASDDVCTEQYGGPETAAIKGTLEGQAVDTTVDRANGCGIGDWDGPLAALLPPPRDF